MTPLPQDAAILFVAGSECNVSDVCGYPFDAAWVRDSPGNTGLIAWLQKAGLGFHLSTFGSVTRDGSYVGFQDVLEGIELHYLGDMERLTLLVSTSLQHESVRNEWTSVLEQFGYAVTEITGNMLRAEIHRSELDRVE